MKRELPFPITQSAQDMLQIQVFQDDKMLVSFVDSRAKLRTEKKDERDQAMLALCVPVANLLKEVGSFKSLSLVNRDGTVIYDIGSYDKVGYPCFVVSYFLSNLEKPYIPGRILKMELDIGISDNETCDQYYSMLITGVQGTHYGYFTAQIGRNEDDSHLVESIISTGSKIMGERLDNHHTTQTLIDGIEDPCIIHNASHIVINTNLDARNILGYNPCNRPLSDIAINSQDLLRDSNGHYMRSGIWELNTDRGPALYQLLRSTPLDLPGNDTQWLLRFNRPTLVPDRIPAAASDPFQFMVGSSSGMLKIKTVAKQVAHTNVNVLILGETGTGKEVLAQAIHQESGRKGAFIAINCGAIPKELIGSELFGYERGAFTGASSEGKAGKIELSDHGTLFLDEIAEMPYDLQVNLLRFLETKQISRLSGSKTMKIDTRVIAATNKDIQREVANGNFREDLYYRLNVVKFKLPPLRERTDDLFAIVTAVLGQLSKQYQMPVIQLVPNSWNLLHAYSWPGNIRELRNVLEGLVIYSQCGLSQAEIFSDFFSMIQPNKEPDSVITEKEAIQSALLQSGGIIARAASILRISRTTLYSKMKKYNLVELKTKQ